MIQRATLWAMFLGDDIIGPWFSHEMIEIICLLLIQVLLTKVLLWWTVQIKSYNSVAQNGCSERCLVYHHLKVWLTWEVSREGRGPKVVTLRQPHPCDVQTVPPLMLPINVNHHLSQESGKAVQVSQWFSKGNPVMSVFPSKTFSSQTVSFFPILPGKWM